MGSDFPDSVVLSRSGQDHRRIFFVRIIHKGIAKSKMVQLPCKKIIRCKKKVYNRLLPLSLFGIIISLFKVAEIITRRAHLLRGMLHFGAIFVDDILSSEFYA